MIRKIISSLLFLFAIPLTVLAENANDRLCQLLEDEWEHRLVQNPLLATGVGDSRYNDRLPAVSIEKKVEIHRANKIFLQRLEDVNLAELSERQQTNHKIFRLVLENRLREFEFQSYLIPITNRSGFHISFPDLRQRVPLKTIKDFQNYIARLNAFAEYTDGHIRILRTGMNNGFTLPSVVLNGCEESIKPHIVDDPQKSLLYEPFKILPSSMDAHAQTALRSKAKDAIRQSVVKGYANFLAFMKKEYIPNARGSIAASTLPNGRAYYRFCVKKFTTLDLTPEEVHQTGMAEVQRIRSEMKKIIKTVGFEGDIAAFTDSLRKDTRFHPKNAEHLMKEVAYTLKQMDGKLPLLFKSLPRTPYGIKRIPDYIAPRTTTAYYMPPPGDGSRAGFYYVNTYDLKSRPLYEVEALSLHEAVPGHHLQIALQQELQDVPNFRRFAKFTVFIEGWALYAERLGLEVGFYQDPYSDFGRLTYEMWRACRLVVDTGMHYLGWTRQQAIDFMAENTALSLHNIRAEVDRYIAWPGQALAYKTGELKIRQLRSRAEQRLGKNFDVRDFHEVVLREGSIPLNVLETNVNAWLEASLTD